MSDNDSFVPRDLFTIFRKGHIGNSKQAIEQFSKLNERSRQAFLQPAIDFMGIEQDDSVRSWGNAVLENIGGNKVFDTLVSMLESADDQDKSNYPYTRFFALKTIYNIKKNKDQTEKTFELIKKVSEDDREQKLIWTLSNLLQALHGHQLCIQKCRDILDNHDEKSGEGFWTCLHLVRGIREFPFPDLTDKLVPVLLDTYYLDLRLHIIKALRYPGYADDKKVIVALGRIIEADDDRATTLAAIKTLILLDKKEAVTDIFRAITNPDAEVRAHSSTALCKLLPHEEAISLLIQKALSLEGEGQLPYYIEALRQIDTEKIVSANLLSNEMIGRDKDRARKAESILIDLGGWTAVSRLSQRRSTLDTLDGLLAESEKAVKDTFNGTILQAQRNFYFALATNILVVTIGITLIILAVIQIIEQPEKLESWLVPGGVGVIGIIINLAFNNPRINARLDLATLLKVNIIFLGFLRALNQIDATFKHAFLESDNFNTDEMKKTVKKIEETIGNTLQKLTDYLEINRK